MVQRILDKLKRGVGIDQLFISTFTVKAAGELKERIEKISMKPLRRRRIWTCVGICRLSDGFDQGRYWDHGLLYAEIGNDLRL